MISESTLVTLQGEIQADTLATLHSLQRRMGWTFPWIRFDRRPQSEIIWDATEKLSLLRGQLEATKYLLDPSTSTETLETAEILLQSRLRRLQKTQ